MAIQIKTFRRYNDNPIDIRNAVQDKLCESCGGFHRHRDGSLHEALRGPCRRCRKGGGGGTCCNDELIQTGQVVLDPGFENIISLTGTDMLPYRTYGNHWDSLLAYEAGLIDDFFAWTPKIQWQGESGLWTVETGGAFEGSHYVHATVGPGTSSGYLIPDQYPMCNFGSKFDPDPPYPVDVEPWIYTAMSPAGSFLDWKLRARGSSSTMQMVVDFWHPDGSVADITSFVLSNQTLTGSWTQYTLSGFLDGTESSAYRFRTGIRVGANSTIDVDNFTVTIS